MTPEQNIAYMVQLETAIFELGLGVEGYKNDIDKIRELFWALTCSSATNIITNTYLAMGFIYSFTEIEIKEKRL